MRWRRSADDSDVIDERSSGGGGGLPIGLPGAGGGIGVLGIVIYLAIQLSEGRIRGYEHPKLVLYRGGVNTACGSATSAVGPFYCPADQRVYLDLSFYSDMTGQLGAKGGDFAWAYVIAHEMGHHVQHELGLPQPHSNAGSVKVELQADCYAGVWAHHVGSAGDLQRATWPRRSTPRPASATTACRSARRARSTRIPSPMAPRRNGSRPSSAARPTAIRAIAPEPETFAPSGWT